SQFLSNAREHQPAPATERIRPRARKTTSGRSAKVAKVCYASRSVAPDVELQVELVYCGHVWWCRVRLSRSGFREIETPPPGRGPWHSALVVFFFPAVSFGSGVSPSSCPRRRGREV